MLRNLFKISIRTLLKDKFYSLLNIVGLTIGISCSLLLALYIIEELSYDKYHQNHENIYRIVSEIKEPDNSFVWAVAQIPLGEALSNNYAGINKVCRFFSLGRQNLKHGTEEFQERRIFLADSTVFEMFSYSFLKGDPTTALEAPNSIVLTELLAKKYFGTIDCVGKALKNGEDRTLQVTGVIRDVPLNSHFIFDGLMSRNTIPDYRGSWGNFGVFTYVELENGTDPGALQPYFNEILDKNVKPIFEEIGISIQYITQNIGDIHLHSKIQDEAESGGDISYIYIFSAIAFFMLVIASINYMNLSTARSSKRSKEVGVRKVLGAEKSQLVAQFLTESFLLTLISMVLSAGLLYLILPGFNQLANKQFEFSHLFSSDLVLVQLLILFGLSILGGSYPALYLSNFKPIKVLKGNLGTKKGGNALVRKVLVIVQFTVSIFMIISTFVVYAQLDYLKNKSLGFNKEQVVRVSFGRNSMPNFTSFKNALKQESSVLGFASASESPGNNISKLIMNVEDDKGEMKERGVDYFSVDFDFIEVMGMEMKEGRAFSREFASDTAFSIVVNEAMVKRMNWGPQAIGKKITFPIGGDQERTAQVIGVVKDYHQNSLYDEIEPLIMFYSKQNRMAFVKIAPQKTEETLELIRSNWSENVSDEAFNYVFLDQDFNSQYKSDERRGQIFTVFSTLTIIIACIGLLGLISFVTEQRAKEIGVRKVIGASVSQIVYLITKDFVLLVLLSIPMAMVLSYQFLNTWLTVFAYKLELAMQWPLFLIASILVIAVTVGTVLYHTYRAANTNPVQVLKDE